LTSIQQTVANPLPAPGLVAGGRVAVTAMRPRQWVKNLLLFAGILFAGRLGSPTAWVEIVVAFTAFCGASSAAYVMNDLRDASADRLHPRKRLRPIACGALSLRRARCLGVSLAVAALALAAALDPLVGAFLVSFAVLQVSYTLGLKRVVLADVLTISLLFVIRAAAGAAAVGVRISPWLLACTFLLALFLACTKRRAELLLVLSGCAPGREVLSHYSLGLLTWLISGTSVAILLVYTAYTMSDRHGSSMVLTVPFVLFGLVRYLHLADAGQGEEPERALLGDAALGLCVVAWTLTSIAVVAV
jgi:4-hydroxybenzoate polyprenyltransferase